MHIQKEVYNQILSCLPIACVDALIIHEGKCLLLLRDNEPAKGQYWFPGGRINKNEGIKEAVLRKAKEETGLDCTFEKIVSIEETMFEQKEPMQTDVHTINICCLLTPINGTAVTTDALHASFIWTDKLRSDFHPGVKNPLALIGFTV